MAIGNYLGIEVRWFDRAHVGLTQSWVVRVSLESTKNYSWRTMAEPGSGSNWFRIGFDIRPQGSGLGLNISPGGGNPTLTADTAQAT